MTTFKSMTTSRHENGKANEEARCAELEALEAVEEWREARKAEAAKAKLAAEEPLFGDFDWQANDDEAEHKEHEDEQDEDDDNKRCDNAIQIVEELG
jgi:hypothetical protein